LNKICAFKLSAEVRHTHPPFSVLLLTPKPHTAQKLQNANHLAPGKVRPALSLVGYPDEVAEAIAFVFSDTLICDDAASAQAVTFAREVGVRSVTLDGDVYEPGGTMSGGAAPSGSGVLMRAQELRASARGALALERRRPLVVRRGTRGARTREIEIKEHELRLLEEQVGTSNAARVRIAFYASTFLFVLKWMVLFAKDRRAN
jgi:structural maintenance of chromosome 2